MHDDMMTLSLSMKNDLNSKVCRCSIRITKPGRARMKQSQGLKLSQAEQPYG